MHSKSQRACTRGTVSGARVVGLSLSGYALEVRSVGGARVNVPVLLPPPAPSAEAWSVGRGRGTVTRHVTVTHHSVSLLLCCSIFLSIKVRK